MTLAEVILSLTWIGVTLYALFGGADFGAGFWDLAAGTTRRGAEARALIEHSIGPVWEANHVWLIFALVVLSTGFPTAFAPIVSTLYIPLTAAAIGVILRGTGFAFRKAVTSLPLERFFGATFAISSLLTPFFFGAVAGSVASGRVPARLGEGDVIRSWFNPTSVLGGLLAVVVSAYLAATYLAADAARLRNARLTDAFRSRALITAAVAGVVAIGGVAVLRTDAPTLFHGLTHRALPLMVASAAGGVGSAWLLWVRRFRPARWAAAGAVTAVVWGWAAAQYPYLLVGNLTIADAAGSRVTQRAMLACLCVGIVVFAPALAWLLVLAERGTLTGPPEDQEATYPVSA